MKRWLTEIRRIEWMCVAYIHSKLRHGGFVRVQVSIWFILLLLTSAGCTAVYIQFVFLSVKGKITHSQMQNPHDMMLKLSLSSLCEHGFIPEAKSLLALPAQLPYTRQPIVPSLALPLTGLSLTKFSMASKLLSVPLHQRVLALHL